MWDSLQSVDSSNATLLVEDLNTATGSVGEMAFSFEDGAGKVIYSEFQF